MIVKYISELLFDHECVIVPEFGAFITKETPAMLDYVNQRMTPPSKEVAFNGQLVADDGVLIGYIAEREGITTTESAKMVHDFAMRSLAVLEASGALRLDGLGVLTRVSGREYIIEFEDDVNLLGDAFGLTTLKVQPIYRRETYHKIEEQIASGQHEKNTAMTVLDEEEQKPHHVNRYNYKWFRAAAYSMLVAFVLVLLGWGADKNGSDLASWNPFFYSSPNEFIAKHLNKRINTVEAYDLERFPMMDYNLPVYSQHESEYLQPVDNELLKPVDDKVYYIIGASVKNDSDACRCVRLFQKKGFEYAAALPVNAQGNIRVAYEQVMGKEAALKRLEIIKIEHNEAAWLLRKK